MTPEEVVKDPRWAIATPEQRERIMARVTGRSSAPSMTQIMSDPKFSKQANLARSAMASGSMPSPMAEIGASSDPVLNAKILPAVAGIAGGMSGVPMGTLAGTVGGRQISNMMLKTMGKEKEIPSGLSQVAEGVLSGVGDLTVVPWINRVRFGRMVGQAEKTAGVPSTVSSLRRVTGPQSTVKFLDDTIKDIGTGELGKTQPIILKQIKDQLDFIRKNRKAVPLTDNDMGKLKFLNRWVQDALGSAIPGRAEAAKALARSQTVPRAISNTWEKVPKSVKTGLGLAAGASGPTAILYQMLGKGGSQGNR